MDDTRAPETASVIQYQRKRKRKQKVKDLETEPESINECAKRECVGVVETTNQFIKENESLQRELDSTRGQLKNLQKCLEEAELKHKAYVELLMKEIKSLRSSQPELRQELYGVEKERTPSLIERTINQEKKEKIMQRTGASGVLGTAGLNNLSDDVLIAILSRMTLVEAVRTSVLSRRWRHLWRFTSGSLDFDVFKTKTRPRMNGDKVINWVNRVIELHQGPRLDSFIVRFKTGGVYEDTIPRWICFAMQKEVKKFELILGDDIEPSHITYYSYYGRKITRKANEGYRYDFPNLKKLLSLKCAFGSLRSLKFESVNVTDEVVHYLLASCSNLERLSITGSNSTRNLEIVDPIPNLKTLGISNCDSLKSLKVSAASILSFSLEGQGSKLLFDYIPNLTELTLIGACALPFIYEYDDNKDVGYSVQLVKLSLHLFSTKYKPAVPSDLPLLYSLKRLELSTECKVGRSLLFFTLLIKAAPVLHEFKIWVNYNKDPYEWYTYVPFPSISEAEAPTFHHENLKLVQLVGYVGCLSEKKFLLHLFKVAPSLEKVVVIVLSQHFGKEANYHQHDHLRTKAQTMKEAKKRAKNLQSIFPEKTKLVVG